MVPFREYSRQKLTYVVTSQDGGSPPALGDGQGVQEGFGAVEMSYSDQGAGDIGAFHL